MKRSQRYITSTTAFFAYEQTQHGRGQPEFILTNVKRSRVVTQWKK